MRLLGKTRSKPWAAHFLLGILLCGGGSIVFAALAVDHWRRLGPAESELARYQAAPACPAEPAPACRATLEGVIERTFTT
jgi:hypothetical protein